MFVLIMFFFKFFAFGNFFEIDIIIIKVIKVFEINKKKISYYILLRKIFYFYFF